MSVMKAYKVIFENNVAISACPIDFFYSKAVEVKHYTGGNSLQWVIIFADDEQEGIANANKMVREYFSFLHLS